MVLGSLREQLGYPRLTRTLTTAEAVSSLERVGLGKLVPWLHDEAAVRRGVLVAVAAVGQALLPAVLVGVKGAEAARRGLPRAAGEAPAGDEVRVRPLEDVRVLTGVPAGPGAGHRPVGSCLLGIASAALRSQNAPARNADRS